MKTQNHEHLRHPLAEKKTQLEALKVYITG